MNTELTNKLFIKYPALCKDRNAPPTQSLMCFGFEVGDGWYKILDETFAEITKVMEVHNCDVTLMQVKEKFGTLRIYYALTSANTEVDDVCAEDDRVYEIVCEAEDKSAKTCEVCGEPGKCNNEGWIKCRCENCKDK
jgi:hypothetical protein